MTNIKTKFTDFVKESVFEGLPDEIETFTITLDTTLDCNDNYEVVIDETDYDAEYLHELVNDLEDNKLEYKVFSEEGLPNQIEMTGTVEQLKNILHHWDAHQRDNADLKIALQDWDGDEDALCQIIC